MSEEEIALWVISGDKALAHQCVICGYHAALFVFQRRPVGLCPKCVSGRIGHIRDRGYPIRPGAEFSNAFLSGKTPPPDEWSVWDQLAWLDQEAIGEVLVQDSKGEKELQVRFDDFVRCYRCEKLLQEKDARYYFPEGEHSAPPCCSPCLDELKREDRWKKTEQAFVRRLGRDSVWSAESRSGSPDLHHPHGPE